MPAAPQNEGIRHAVGCIVVIAFSFFLGVTYFVSNGGTEQIATLQLSDEATAFIYAEGEFLYEPPGYLSLQVQTTSRDLVPRYDFKPDHGIRVPKLPFSTSRSDDCKVSAVTQFRDAVFIIDFDTHSSLNHRVFSCARSAFP